jgi:predicted ATPase
MFIVGPNASGKSNLLDVFRFLRDIAKPEGGGLQKAIRDRGGLSKIRCLAARQEPQVDIDIEIAENSDGSAVWRYSISIRQETSGYRRPFLAHEKVWHDGKLIINRPDDSDKNDPDRRTQTYLEQINTNQNFRDISRFLQSVTYLHLVPQFLRYADEFQGKWLENDPFGQGLLERIAKTQDKYQKARLRKIEEALNIVVPQLEQLKFSRDENNGRPHLEALYSHWRPNAGWQKEDQFSDGTLRLIGLFWSLLEKNSLLLLEEPELSLNSAIVSRLAPLIWRMQRQRKRQVLISTHSMDMLSDEGIGPREVLLLTPEKEGTSVEIMANIEDAMALMQGGMSVGDALMPRSTPKNIEQLGLFFE